MRGGRVPSKNDDRRDLAEFELRFPLSMGRKMVGKVCILGGGRGPSKNYTRREIAEFELRFPLSTGRKMVGTVCKSVSVSMYIRGRDKEEEERICI